MQELPFPSASLHGGHSRLRTAQRADIEEAIDEIARVLAPRGRLLSLDFNRPAHPAVRAAYLTYLTIVGSVLGLVLHRDPDTYRYIPGIDPQLSRGGRRGAPTRRTRIHRRTGGAAARRVDGHSSGQQGRVGLSLQPGLERLHEEREDVGFVEILRTGTWLDRPLVL